MTLYRIRALLDVSDDVKKGELGGWVEREENLSQQDNSWIYGQAKVMGNSFVKDDAWVGHKAVLMGNVVLRGQSYIIDYAVVKGEVSLDYNSSISDNAYVDSKNSYMTLNGFASISENAHVEGRVQMTGESQIKGHARVDGFNVSGCSLLVQGIKLKDSSIIGGSAYVFGSVLLADHAEINEDAIVTSAKLSEQVYIGGNAVVGDTTMPVFIDGFASIVGDATVVKRDDYQVFKNTWSSGRHFTYTKSNGMWKVGCFFGTGKELVEKAYKDSVSKGKKYELYVNLVKDYYNL